MSIENALFKNILKAHVYDVAIETPLEEAPLLSKRLHNKILIKREDLQSVFSFKIRGAYNRMRLLSPAEKKQGVITSSAGNHAQGVALSANTLGIKATIVMPNTTAEIKINSVKERGATVILHGDNFDEASTYAQKLATAKKLIFVHPYDDLDVIAGQGTIARELLQQYSDKISAIFVPVGGGGLIAGIAIYCKMLRPDIKIIGVEPEDSACLKAALEKGRPLTLKNIGLFADGVAVKKVGKEPFKFAKKYVDDVITVSNDEICAAIKDIFNDNRSVAEPSGALAVAGLKKYGGAKKIKNQTLIAIESGANVNFDRLRYVVERSEIGEQREALLAVTIPEKIGSFKTFCQALQERDITEFNYRYNKDEKAHIFVGIKLPSEKNKRILLLQHLKNKKYAVDDLSNNEMAKLHVRHMVGGHGKELPNECVYLVEFREHPGALMKFLKHLGQRWNITMFHYRNHGADYGRVLLGLQIPEAEKAKANKHLKSKGYRFFEESDNIAYTLFLS